MRNADIETLQKRIPRLGVQNVHVKFVVDYPMIILMQTFVKNMVEGNFEEVAREIRNKWGGEVVKMF